MTKDEAEQIIKNSVKPKPTKYWYDDPYKDGYANSSGWVYEYPPVSGQLIDALLERDKDCKPYVTDDELQQDEKFNAEMEKRFTDLMNRAKDTAVDEYRKKNLHLYSMVTENNGNKITVIPMSFYTLSDFEEKCEKASNEIGLKNFCIYEHKDSNDINGKIVCSSSSFGGYFINHSAKTAFSDALRYCDYFKRHANECKSYEVVEKLCDSISELIKNLCDTIELDYAQRVNNYISKCKTSINE